MSKYNLLDIYEGMTDAEHAEANEKDRLEKHPDKDKIKKIQALMRKEKGVKENEAVDLAVEAIDLEPGISGERTVNHDRKMALSNIMSVLGAEGVKQDEIFSFIKTHRDDIFSGDIDAHDKEDIISNYKEYLDINSEDFSDLQEHFGRFLKPFQ